MNSKTLGIAIIALIAGLVGGFVLANGFNRSTMNALKSQIDTLSAKKTSLDKADEMELGLDEIKAKITEADANPTNLTFQKNLGGGLYRYATMKKDTALLDEALRILIRANQIDPKDYQVLVDLGNAYFDTGYFKKDALSLRRSREFYESAMAQKPDDADVRADYALSFYLDEPADLTRAVLEFQRAIKANPRQERAMQYLTETYIRQSDFTNAQSTLNQLKSVNPKNDAVGDLTTQIENRTAAPIQ